MPWTWRQFFRWLDTNWEIESSSFDIKLAMYVIVEVIASMSDLTLTWNSFSYFLSWHGEHSTNTLLNSDWNLNPSITNMDWKVIFLFIVDLSRSGRSFIETFLGTNTHIIPPLLDVRVFHLPVYDLPSSNDRPKWHLPNQQCPLALTTVGVSGNLELQRIKHNFKVLRTESHVRSPIQQQQLDVRGWRTYPGMHLLLRGTVL